jgi:uncharacterized protein
MAASVHVTETMAIAGRLIYRTVCMKVPLQPLSDDEELALGQLLLDCQAPNSARAAGLSHMERVWLARGVLTALAIEPHLSDPISWLPLVLGSEAKDVGSLKQTLNLLLRDRFVIAECLQLAEPLVPDAGEETSIVQFCKGLTRACQANKHWQADKGAWELTLPLAVVAGYLKFESLRSVLPEIAVDEQTWRALREHDLPEQLRKLHAHFAPARASYTAPPAAPKVGRNEPCPCGSGRKFKKCCGSNA